MINELVAWQKRFAMMAYPNRRQGIQDGNHTTLHLYILLTPHGAAFPSQPEPGNSSRTGTGGSRSSPLTPGHPYRSGLRWVCGSRSGS